MSPKVVLLCGGSNFEWLVIFMVICGLIGTKVINRTCNLNMPPDLRMTECGSTLWLTQIS